MDEGMASPVRQLGGILWLSCGYHVAIMGLSCGYHVSIMWLSGRNQVAISRQSVVTT